MLIAPSLLSADFSHLEKDILMVNNSEADWFHIDVMDGVFVPNISFGFPVIKAINKYASKPLDVHLMIVEPDRYITLFRDAGVLPIERGGVLRLLLRLLPARGLCAPARSLY